MFKDLDRLPDDDQFGKRFSMAVLTQEDFDEEYDDLKEDEEELEKKKKSTKDPTVSEVREQMKKMIFFYEKNLQASIATTYPLIGPVGDYLDDHEGGRGGGGGGGGGGKGKNSNKSKKTTNTGVLKK
jgi:hypothetical protein